MNLSNDTSDEKALQEFLLDIDCLNALNEWTNKFNLFDVLKISRTEIRHSNMLSWLLSPRENHGLNDGVIRGLVEKVINTQNIFNLDVFKVLLMDFYEFKVLREWKNIDLLLVADNSKLVICIENKVQSSEHSNQLNRYKETVNRHYENYDKIYIYLTPNGDEASDNEHWASLSYAELMDIITTAMDRSQPMAESELLIKNYIETVRWHIVGDDRIMKVCNDIYNKHKKALDLIFEYKIDGYAVTQSTVKDIFKKYAEDKNDLVLRKSGGNYLHFATKNMINTFPNYMKKLSGWKTNYFVSYELSISYGVVKIYLMISKGDLSNEECESMLGKLIHNEKPKDNIINWTWKRVKNYKLLTISEDDNLDGLEEKIYKKIEETMVKVIKDENEIFAKLK